MGRSRYLDGWPLKNRTYEYKKYSFQTNCHYLIGISPIKNKSGLDSVLSLYLDIMIVSYLLIIAVHTTLNDVFTHFEQLRYLVFYTLTKLSVILPHGVRKLTQKF
jgi:hypothetical protein